MKRTYLLVAAAVMLAWTPSAFAQEAEAEAESEATSQSAAGAAAATGDVTVTFESPEPADELTIHAAPSIGQNTPDATISCFIPRGVTMSVIDLGVGYGGGHTDPDCREVENLRIAAAIFGNVPALQPVLVEMARDVMPSFNRAYERVYGNGPVSLVSLPAPTPQPSAQPVLVATRQEDSVHGSTQ